jgi:hypothetical protein
MPEPKKPDELTQFASDLQLMRDRAISLHLYATGQRLDWAIQMAGFEIAGDPEGCNKYEAAQAASTNFQKTALSAKGLWTYVDQNKSCPDCGSSEFEMRTYGGPLEYADTHCAKCGKLIRRFDG